MYKILLRKQHIDYKTLLVVVKITNVIITIIIQT
jgi:hypothetical protein